MKDNLFGKAYYKPKKTINDQWLTTPYYRYRVSTIKVNEKTFDISMNIAVECNHKESE